MTDKTPRICNSAGHGPGSRGAGSDPGADVVTSPKTESDITLMVATLVDKDYGVLFEDLPGSFHMLRNQGMYYLADNEAAAHNCDVFNEFHTDASTKHPHIDGVEMGVSVLYDDPNDKEYAEKMSRNIANALHIPNRGAKRRTDLAVLNPHPGMIQVIIEMFFGTDADDVAAYRKYHIPMEIAILNTNLEHWGMRKIESGVPPRLWDSERKAYYKKHRFIRNY